MRQVVLDTETTGLDAQQGHRIIEIGCIEIIDRISTGRHYHVYINPDREVDEGAFQVHGISNEFLSDKPRFSEIVGDFLEFVKGSELIIHNAPFDVGFLNAEFSLLGASIGRLDDYCQVLDTLVMSRHKHPGQRHTLNNLCKIYGVDLSRRDLHGALLDADLLCQVYLAMTGGQTALSLDAETADEDGALQDTIQRVTSASNLKVILASEQEQQAHEVLLNLIEKKSGQALWRVKEKTQP